MDLFLSNSPRSQHRHLAAHLVVAVVALGTLLFAKDAMATDPTPLQKAESAYKSGDFKTCHQVAKAELLKGESHDLRFFKARCAFKLRQLDAAWGEFQKVHPAHLDARFQDAFVTEYESAEKAFKKEKQTEADVAALVAKQAREDASKRTRNMLIAGGVGVLAGGALLYLGIDKSSEADELDITIPAEKTEQVELRSTATILQAAGMGVAAIGVGVCIWAFIDDGDATTTAWSVQPTIGPRGNGTGMVFQARF